MPKGTPKKREEGAEPRKIPTSQSVLYRTIKKALASTDGYLKVPYGDVYMTYTAREIYDALVKLDKAKAGTVTWGARNMPSACYWNELRLGGIVDGVGMMSALHERVVQYHRAIELAKMAKQGEVAA